jgi:hypothetical protein
MATYNPFLDPDFISNTGTWVPKLNGTVQAAPQPQQPQQPQLPAGVGELLGKLGQAYENLGLAAPGHGRNQTLEDRANMEGATAAKQRATFNEAFPRGRGKDGLVEVPKIDVALANRAYAERRAGGDTHRYLGNNNLKINQEQLGFQRLQGKNPDGSPRIQSIQAPPLSWGGVLTPQAEAPANTGRGGDFRDPKTGAVSGLIDYHAPDGVKFKDTNVWTAGPIPKSDPRGPGIYDTEYLPPDKLAEMQHVRDRVTGKRGGPIAPPKTRFTPVAAGGAEAPPPPPAPALDMSSIGDYLAQHGATAPMETRLGLPQPPAPRLPWWSPSAPPSYGDVSQPAEPQVEPPGVDEAAANQAAWDRYDAAVPPLPKPPKSPEQQGLEDLWNWIDQQNTWDNAERDRRNAG